MQKVVLASGNAGKLKELRSALWDVDIDLIPQQQLHIEDAVEDGLSFVENAIIKARHACRESGLPALADDSGLRVDALDGAPGVYSARFAEQLKANLSGDRDTDNNRLLLELLVDSTERQANFICVMVFMRHATDPTPLIAEGRWHGEISTHAVGDGGFGYDPLFYLPKLGKHAAELPIDLKNRISHRGLALDRLRQLLRQN